MTKAKEKAGWLNGDEFKETLQWSSDTCFKMLHSAREEADKAAEAILAHYRENQEWTLKAIEDWRTMAVHGQKAAIDMGETMVKLATDRVGTGFGA